MEKVVLSLEQARRYMLLSQGLLGEYRFTGKNGIMEYFEQARCVQFDPVDICGKSPELTLLARVKGFRKEQLDSLLYEERTLFDYFDKNLCIIMTDDYKCFEPRRAEYRAHTRGKAEVDAVTDDIKRILNERGFASSQELGMDKKVDWYWSETNLSRAALETMYFRGEIIIHHKVGTVKYYCLPGGKIPDDVYNAAFPFESGEDYAKWRALRRISAVSLMWARASDAWLDMRDFHAAERKAAFDALLRDGSIVETAVEGVDEAFFIPKTLLPFANMAKSDEKFKERTEFIAPLDSFMWDRKLIRRIFDFEYTWEIYTKVENRKYGHYVLPIIQGERFIGRAEMVNERKTKTLVFKNIWLESGVRETKKLVAGVRRAAKRLGDFNGCDAVRDESGRL